jgi:hypothetical protein
MISANFCLLCLIAKGIDITTVSSQAGHSRVSTMLDICLLAFNDKEKKLLSRCTRVTKKEET